MKILSFAAALALTLALAASPALAMQRAAVPPPHLQVNPSDSLSAAATRPVQAQVQDDYAAQLAGQQRQLLQQNPSGSTRLEISIGHALNGF
jgi:hypothetical protein